MKMTDIQAPADLRERTLILMEKEKEAKDKKGGTKPLLLIALPAAMAVSGLLLYTAAALSPPDRNVESMQTEVSVVEGHMEQLAEGFSESTVLETLKQTAENENFIPYALKPVEDNTSPDAVAAIKAGFSLRWPLATDFHISRAYNDYPENGVPLHAETDIAAEEGTEIYPLCEGAVAETGFDASRGNYIVIDHGDGLFSTYSHCKEVLVSRHDTVTAASAVATVGKSGMATGPFLAFSVTFNGTPVNPEKLFE